MDGYRLEMKMFDVHSLPADPGVLFTRVKGPGPKSRRQELHEALSHKTTTTIRLDPRKQFKSMGGLRGEKRCGLFCEH